MTFKNVVIDFLSPIGNKSFKSRNDNSVVFKLKYQNFEMLFTGDIERKAEKYVLKEIKNKKLQSDILKVSHHGSNTSSTNRFIDKVDPIHALISVGPNNFGHPNNTVISKFKKNKIKVWRTDKKGAIIIKTDGFNYNINSILN